MKNQFNLNIKTPCQENFNSFSKTPNGGFCQSCKHEVVDFTTMDHKEISLYFSSKENNNTCGRFKQSQLAAFATPVNKTKINFFKGIGLACISFFSLHNLQAQDVIIQTDSMNNSTNIQNQVANSPITVSGMVTEDSIPLPGVNILLQGTNIGTTSNFDGYFEFPKKLKKGDVLLFSFIGMESQKVVIEDESSPQLELKVNMNSDSYILMGKVAVKEVYKSK